MKRNPVTDAVTGELDALGIRWEWRPAGKHARICFRWRKAGRFVTVPLTPSESQCAPQNAISQLRRLLGLKRRIVKNPANRRRRDTCRPDDVALPALSVAGSGFDALAEHPAITGARKEMGGRG